MNNNYAHPKFIAKVKAEMRKGRPFRLSFTDNKFANMLNAPIQKCFNERKMYVEATKRAIDPNVIADYEVANMLMNDARDLREVRNHIIKGRLDLAGKKVWDLDTAVRDIIPSALYNVLDMYVA